MIPLNFSSNYYHGNKKFEFYILFDNYNIKTRFISWKGDFNSSLEMFFRMFLKEFSEKVNHRLDYDDFSYFYMSKSQI